MAVIKKHLTTIVLFALLLVLAVWSLFIGVLDVELSGLLQGDREHLEVFLISRLPRLLAILCTGIGMSVAGLIMQQLCMNKFFSPTTGATIPSAVRHPAGAAVHAQFHPVGESRFFFRICGPWHLDICLVHSACPI